MAFFIKYMFPKADENSKGQHYELTPDLNESVASVIGAKNYVLEHRIDQYITVEKLEELHAQPRFDCLVKLYLSDDVTRSEDVTDEDWEKFKKYVDDKSTTVEAERFYNLGLLERYGILQNKQ